MSWLKRMGDSFRWGGKGVTLEQYAQLWLAGAEDRASPARLGQPYAQSLWVYACVSALARNVARVSFRVVDEEGRRVEDHPLARLITRPNPCSDAYEFWEATVGFLHLDGNAFWILGEMAGRRPTVIQVAGRSQMRPARDPETGVLVGWYYQAGSGQREQPIPLTVDEVCHLRLWNPYDRTWGLSPLSAARLSVSQDYHASRFNESFFVNAAEPGGLLQTPQMLTEEQVRQIRAQWESRHRGTASAKRVAILYGGLSWQNTGVNQKDMEFVQLRKMSREEIAAAFKVPPIEIGVLEYANYANAQAQREMFFDNTVEPLLRRLEAKFNAAIASRFWPTVRGVFDREGIDVLQEKRQRRIEQAMSLVDHGVPLNDALRAYGVRLPEYPWGGEWWVQRSRVPASTVLSGSGSSRPGGRRQARGNGDGLSTPPVQTGARHQARWATPSERCPKGLSGRRVPVCPALADAECERVTGERVGRLARKLREVGLGLRQEALGERRVPALRKVCREFQARTEGGQEDEGVRRCVLLLAVRSWRQIREKMRK